MKIAEIVSVGTELLLGQITDTHAPTMARLLAECGIGCQRRSTVGDNWERVVGTLKEALERSDVVITIGGLGPTADDLTREAIAAALGDDMVREQAMAAQLRRFFESRGLPFSESNLKQADHPTSGRFIDNPNGTAPGLLCEKDGKVVIALPGPRGEFNPMAFGPVKEYLQTLSGGEVIHSRVLRVCGLGESYVEKLLGPIMDRQNPTVAPYAHVGEVHLRVTARASSVGEADALIDPVEGEIRALLGANVYATDETNLEAAVLQNLRERGLTVAVAESMSGGGLGERLTSVAGSSDVFVGGAIVYQASAKKALLGLSDDLVADPVSEATTRALAEAVRSRTGSDYGVAITGNAGPTSDIGGKPVGLVFVAVAGPEGTKVNESQFRGIREDIRRRSTQTALVMLRNAVLGT